MAALLPIGLARIRQVSTGRLDPRDNLEHFCLRWVERRNQPNYVVAAARQQHFHLLI